MKLSKEEGGLGFRDLHSFNMAMLARQGWRLLQAPDSLCARVLRAKYYPSGSLLDAEPVTGMSYVWRSVLGLLVIKKGIIWRVGDGSKVRIWEDPWIPRGTTRRPASYQGPHLFSKVSELLDPITGSWDTDLVTNCFHHDDVQHILRIPICDQAEDFIAWHFDSKGVFSVKSAYKVHVQMLKNEATRQQGHSSVVGNQNAELFRALWKIHCPLIISSGGLLTIATLCT